MFPTSHFMCAMLVIVSDTQTSCDWDVHNGTQWNSIALLKMAPLDVCSCCLQVGAPAQHSQAQLLDAATIKQFCGHYVKVRKASFSICPCVSKPCPSLVFVH